MFWALIALVVVAVGAVVFLLVTASPPKQKTREDFLAAFAKHTDGVQSQLPGDLTSFKIDFDFEGHHFWYEDIESEGFTQKVYKGILKVKSNTNINMIFVKKDRNKILGSDMQMMSNLSDSSVNKHTKVYVPSDLKEFEVFTQEFYKVNQMFEDRKVRSILSSVKQLDRQGEPFMPFSMSDGVICFEFSSDDRMKLCRSMLIENLPILEKIADNMIALGKAADKTNPVI